MITFGITDHLDRGIVPLSEQYETRLRLIDEYEKSGWFHNFQLTEHHGTPLGMAPSPSVFLAAVSQRTEKMRVGTLVYTLPIYHPYRLYEEICMLDQMSQGRLDLGIGRGASPVEMSFLSVDINDADRMYTETLEILMKCFEGGRLTHHGDFYSFDDVPIEIQPFQKPRPPLWYGIGNPGLILWAVENRVNLMTNYTAKHARELHDLFLKEWLAAGNESDDLPFFGSSKHIIVAETDAQARKLADTAYRMYSHHTTLLAKRSGIPRTRTWIEDVDEALASGILFAGSPTTVRDGLASYLLDSGANFLSVRPAFGDLTYQQSLETLNHLTESILPDLVDSTASSNAA